MNNSEQGEETPKHWREQFKEAWFRDNDSLPFKRKNELWKLTERSADMAFQYISKHVRSQITTPPPPVIHPSGLPWISADNPPNKNGYYICWLTDEQGLIHYHVDTGWQNGFYNDKVTHYILLTPPDESAATPQSLSVDVDALRQLFDNNFDCYTSYKKIDNSSCDVPAMTKKKFIEILAGSHQPSTSDEEKVIWYSILDGASDVVNGGISKRDFIEELLSTFKISKR